MSPPPPPEASGASGGGVFPDTQWSLVVEAQCGEGATAALQELCERYWKPLYVFVRSKGLDIPESEDAVQGFFEKLLRTESWRNLDVAKGRLRSFLLQSMRYYLANASERENAQKRGGGMVFAMDFSAVEPEVQRVLEDHASPDVLFDQSWVGAVLARVMALLRAEAEGRGRGESFEALAPLIPEKGSRSGFGDVAARLRITESDVRLRLFRMRKRYRELLRSEIGQTVSSPEEVDREIAELFEIVAGP